VLDTRLQRILVVPLEVAPQSEPFVVQLFTELSFVFTVQEFGHFLVTHDTWNREGTLHEEVNQVFPVEFLGGHFSNEDFS
jgi:hypothetical protein